MASSTPNPINISIRRQGETPFFHVLNQVSEAEVNAIPVGRGGAQFAKYAKAHGSSRSLNLLTPESSNAKTAKNQKSVNPMARLSSQTTMALSPADKSGVTNTCGTCTSKGCYNNCLNDANQMSGAPQQRAQVNRTGFAVEDPAMFIAHLRDSLNTHAEDAYAQGLHPVARLNTLSDTAFERLKAAPAIYGRYVDRPSGLRTALPKEIQHLPGMTFSEYTGENMRGPRGVPEAPHPFSNIHKIYSAKEHTTLERAHELLSQGLNVTLPVVKGPKDPVHPVHRFVDISGGPSHGKYLDAPAYNADRDDARWADPEEGHFAVLTEKRPGNFAGKDASGNKKIINTHDNSAGFIRENIAGESTASSPAINIPGMAAYNRRKLNTEQFGA